MDNFGNPNNVVAFTMWLLLLLLDATAGHSVPTLSEPEEEADDTLDAVVQSVREPVIDTYSLTQSTLHNFRLCNSSHVFHDDIIFWVKPRSTTWFSRFLLEQYDNTRWVTMFRMTKSSVFALAELLRPQVQKKDTKYRLAIPVLVRVACTLFKLTHGANLTICSEMFAIGRSTVSKVLREVVHAINDSLKHEIQWPTGEKMQETQAKFSDLCALPGIVGAIDGMQIPICKPKFGAADYFYFKSGGYSMNCQAVVDSEKRFIDLYVGMPGSTNDSRMLRRSSLYNSATHGNLMDASLAVDGYTPYLIGDLGYPLLPWLMVPHKAHGHLSISEALFNRKLRRGRCVVENAFGILKQSFRELLEKSDLEVTFLPDVVLCCAILHNLLLRQSHEEVEDLLHVLRMEGLAGEVVDDDVAARLACKVVDNDAGARDTGGAVVDDVPGVLASERREQLGVYLTTRRRRVP